MTLPQFLLIVAAVVLGRLLTDHVWPRIVLAWRWWMKPCPDCERLGRECDECHLDRAW